MEAARSKIDDDRSSARRKPPPAAASGGLAVALLLASWGRRGAVLLAGAADERDVLYRGSDRGGHYFAAAVDADGGAAGDGAGPKRQQQQPQPQETETERRMRRQRRDRRRRLPPAQGPNPFLPDFTNELCRNDKPADAWMANPPDSMEECCSGHFSWMIADCSSASQQWLEEHVAIGNNGVDNEGGRLKGVKGVTYYPDSNLHVCKVVTALMPRPSWHTSETEYETCCANWFGWNLEECLAENPHLSTSSNDGDVGNGGGKGSGSGGGGSDDVSNGGESSGSGTSNNGGSGDKGGGKGGMVANNAVSDSPPASAAPGPDRCEALTTRKHCKQQAPFCSWMEDPMGVNFCASPYSVDSQGYSNHCSGRERDNCEGEDRCNYNKKRGCLAAVVGGDVGKVGNGGSGSGNGSGGNVGGVGSKNNVVVGKNKPPSCVGLPREECKGAGGCEFDKKEGCFAVLGDSNSSSGDVNSGDGSGDTKNNNGSKSKPAKCDEFERDECDAHPKQCSWHKKRQCQPVSASDNGSGNNNDNDNNNGPNNSSPKAAPKTPNPTLDPTPRQTPDPTPQPTPRPTPSPTRMQWYYDSGDGLCKQDGKDRLTWIRDMHDDPEVCCQLSWFEASCNSYVKKLLGGLSDDSGDDGDVAEDEEAPREFYYDTGDGKCKPNGPDRPEWLCTLYGDFERCCAASWDKKACMLSKHSPGKEQDDPSGVEDVDDSFLDPIFIELTVYGSVDLHMNSLPSQASKEWNRLKRALTKSIILVMMELDVIHPDSIEVELWSIGGVSFNWQRERRLHEHDYAEGGLEEEVEEETPSSSSLRGGTAPAVRQRRRLEVQELKFELTVLTQCDGACQSDTLVALGTAPSQALNDYFQTVVSSGVFMLQLKIEGEAMGLFKDGAPSASDGELVYNYAEKTDLGDELTWRPTNRPTEPPTDVTGAPTLDRYYPDIENLVCRTGDGPDTNVYYYGSMEKCCHFPWMKSFDVCMLNSEAATRPTWRPTRRPTRGKRPQTKRPTRRSTKAPKPMRKPKGPNAPGNPGMKRPSQRPAKAPKPTRNPPTDPNPPNAPNEPTSSGPTTGDNPLVGPPSPAKPSGDGPVVYYPDLNLGVCKFDGRHGNIPYQFPTAAACCTNQWMDYNKCMAYADPYHFPQQTKFYPDIYAGYCKSDGGHVGLDELLVFDSAEGCCDNVWMVYADCLVRSVGGTPPSASNPMVTTNPGPAVPTTPVPNPGPTPPNPGPNATPTPDTQHPTSDPTSYPTHGPTPNLSKKILDPGGITGEFYPDFDAGVCLNDGKQFGQVYIFDTLESCCKNNLMDYQDCVIFSLEMLDDDEIDVNLCLWHPDPTKFGTCTYSSMYPNSWAEPDKKDKYLFDTLESCCIAAFGGPGCRQNYSCNGTKAGPTPTGYVTQPPTTFYPTFNPTLPPIKKAATKAPTPKPPPEPTPKPTRKPTPKPVRAPTPRPNPAKPTPPANNPKPYTAPSLVTSAIDATGITHELFDGFENGLTGGFPWHTSPDLPWTTYTGDSSEGAFSSRSHVVEPGENSDLQLAIKSTNGGILKFDFKTGVQMPFHGCYINIDDESVRGFTFPKEEWLALSLDIPKGERVVLFRAWAPDLSRPNIQPRGDGTIGLDNVRFTPNPG